MKQFFKTAKIRKSVGIESDRFPERIRRQFPTAIRVRYYRNNAGKTRQTVEIPVYQLT